MRQLPLIPLKCSCIIVYVVIDGQPDLSFLNDAFLFNNGKPILLDRLPRKCLNLAPPRELRELFIGCLYVGCLFFLIVHDVVIVLVLIILVVADGADGAGLELHDVCGESAGLVREDVLDLRHFFMKSHVHGFTLFVGGFIVHVDIMIDERSLSQFNELDGDYQRERDQRTHEDKVLAIRENSLLGWVIADARGVSSSTVF